MTPKQLKVIAIVLVVALALWGVSELVSGRSDKTAGERVFAGLDLASIDSFVITRKTDTLHFVKRPSLWTVNGHLASGLEMDGFFKQLADTTPTEVAAENSASHQRMGVDSIVSRRLQIYAGGQVKSDIFVGERGPDYQSSYVRRPGEARVSLRYGPFAGFVDRAVDDWREKRMANVPPDSVARVDVTRKHRRYSIVKKDGTWQFADGKAVDTAAVSRFLKGLHPLTATGIAAPADVKNVRFTTPDARVVLKGAGGQTLVNLVADSMPNGYWVQADSGGPVYRNGVWIADEMAPWDSTLRKK